MSLHSEGDRDSPLGEEEGLVCQIIMQVRFKQVRINIMISLNSNVVGIIISFLIVRFFKDLIKG